MGMATAVAQAALMRKQVFPSNHLSPMRSMVWLGFAAMILLFWGSIAALVISLFR